MKNNLIIGIVIVAILLVGGFIAYSSAATVQADGTASVKVVPNEVSVNINIETRNTTAILANEQNNEISEVLLFELVKAGFDRDELKFVDKRSYEDYDYGYDYSRTPKLKGYVVSQQLVVKTNNTDKVSAIVDAAINSGALVSYINFEISQEKQNEYQNQVLEAATKNAKEKAASKARGLGKTLWGLISLNEGGYNYGGPVPMYASKGAEMDVASANAEARNVAINLSPDTQEISATVSVKYRLSLF